MHVSGTTDRVSKAISNEDSKASLVVSTVNENEPRANDNETYPLTSFRKTPQANQAQILASQRE